MNKVNYHLLLTLLLIKKGNVFSNSYNLMRILEWKFQIINSKQILDRIKEGHYADFKIINGIHYYTLTLQGKILIEQEHHLALKFLIETHPGEADTIKKSFFS